MPVGSGKTTTAVIKASPIVETKVATAPVKVKEALVITPEWLDFKQLVKSVPAELLQPRVITAGYKELWYPRDQFISGNNASAPTHFELVKPKNKKHVAHADDAEECAENDG